MKSPKIWSTAWTRAKWQKTLKERKEGDPQPTCPACKGEMKHWNCWLVDGDTCKECGFTDNIGLC